MARKTVKGSKTSKKGSKSPAAAIQDSEQPAATNQQPSDTVPANSIPNSAANNIVVPENNIPANGNAKNANDAEIIPQPLAESAEETGSLAGSAVPQGNNNNANNNNNNAGPVNNNTVVPSLADSESVALRAQTDNLNSIEDPAATTTTRSMILDKSDNINRAPTPTFEVRPTRTLDQTASTTT